MQRLALRILVACSGMIFAGASIAAADGQAPKPVPVPPPEKPATQEQAPAPVSAPSKPATQAPAPVAPPVKPATQEAAPPEDGTETPAVVIDGTADSILGKPVLSPKGDDLGRIIDVIVDRSGVVRAAVIDFGGFLGVGSRKIAVDWRILQFPKKGSFDKVIADLPQDQLRIAPRYKAGEPVVVVGRVAAPPKPVAPPPPPPVPPPAAAPAPPPAQPKSVSAPPAKP